MYSQIKKKKVSQLSEPSSLDGFFAFGMDGDNNSVKVPIELLKGNEGNEGKTPSIGENGNWYLGDVDTGVHAQGEPGKDGADGGLQIVSDGETISNDGEYLIVSNGTITISTSIDLIPQSALNIVGALLPNGTFNTTSGYWHTPITAIPAGKTKMKVIPLPDNLGGRSLAFYTSTGAFISTIPNTATDTPVLVDIPGNATQYALCRASSREYFAGFVSDGTQTYTNTDKIVLIKMLNGGAQINELRDLVDYDRLQLISNNDTIQMDGQYLFIEDGNAKFINELDGVAFEKKYPRSDISIAGYISDTGAFVSNSLYSRTEKLAIPTGALEIELYSNGEGSLAKVLAFYDSTGAFISTPPNMGSETLITVPIPSGAKMYAVCQGNAITTGYTIRAYYEIAIPKSALSISGYIRDDGELMGSGSYSRTPMTDIPIGTTEFEVYSWGDGSRARVLAFYDENEVFISAPDNKGEGLLDVVKRPYNAAKYVLSQSSAATYGCTIKVSGNTALVTNDNSIRLVTKKKGVVTDKVLRDFSKSSIKVPNRPKAFLKAFLLNSATITTNTVNITGTGSATANQLRYKAYLSTENIYFDVSFKANSDSDIRIGRSEGGSFKLKGNTLTVYTYQNTEFASFTLPFSIVAGKSYSVSLDKPDALNLRFTLSSATGDTFTVNYDKLTAAGTTTSWGVPFFGVVSGDVTVRNAVLSFKYDYNTIVSIFGDSYIEGNSLLTSGGVYNKWSSLLADETGTSFVHISGKGGELANAAFVSRFKIENSLFKSPYVILALGTNNTDFAIYTTYMQQMIDECRANGQVPILQTIPPRQGVTYGTYTKLVNDWVKASGELYIDFNAALTKPDDESVWIPKYMMSDGVHPTVDGHAAMFEQVKRDLSFLIG